MIFRLSLITLGLDSDVFYLIYQNNVTIIGEVHTQDVKLKYEHPHGYRKTRLNVNGLKKQANNSVSRTNGTSVTGQRRTPRSVLNIRNKNIRPTRLIILLEQLKLS